MIEPHVPARWLGDEARLGQIVGAFVSNAIDPRILETKLVEAAERLSDGSPASLRSPA